MTIQERLRRSNFIMLVEPVVIAMVWLILGLILGSLYAIANGPASLNTPLPPLSAATFHPLAFLTGAAVLLALEGVKKAVQKQVK